MEQASLLVCWTTPIVSSAHECEIHMNVNFKYTSSLLQVYFQQFLKEHSKKNISFLFSVQL